MSSASSGVTGLANRYAVALFQLADELKKLDEVSEDVTAILTIMEGSDDLRQLVTSPVIARQDQGVAMDTILRTAGISDLMISFVGVVARNRRLSALEHMCMGFRDILAKRRGEVKAEVKAAHPLSDNQLKELEEKLRTLISAKVKIDFRVDESLIGGMTVKVGSRMVDSTIKTKIQRLELSMKGAA